MEEEGRQRREGEKEGRRGGGRKEERERRREGTESLAQYSTHRRGRV